MSAFDTRNQYCAFLEKRGYEPLGGGMYARVYAKPNSELVIKVARASDSWPDYIKWATEQGYAGLYAPKVYALKYYSGFYVAVMERLVCTLNELQLDNNYRLTPYDTLANCLRHWADGGEYGADNSGCDGIREFAIALNETPLANDLHGGNIMLRKDGQIVLTDPSSHASDTRLRIKNGEIIPHCN